MWFNYSISDDQDFIEGSFNITFLPGETRKCAPVMIVDDQIVEKREEDFEIEFVLLPTPLNATIGGPSTIPVTIIDDDSEFNDVCLAD